MKLNEDINLQATFLSNHCYSSKQLWRLILRFPRMILTIKSLITNHSTREPDLYNSTLPCLRDHPRSKRINYLKYTIIIVSSKTYKKLTKKSPCWLTKQLDEVLLYIPSKIPPFIYQRVKIIKLVLKLRYAISPSKILCML